MKSESLEKTEAECAEGRTAPRVKLSDIEASMDHVLYATADKLLPEVTEAGSGEDRAYLPLRLLTLCIVVMTNGFTIIGKSAPASAANFDAELGKKLAYEDAVRQIWPLMGFALRDRLHHAQNEADFDMSNSERPASGEAFTKDEVEVDRPPYDDKV